MDGMNQGSAAQLLRGILQNDPRYQQAMASHNKEAYNQVVAEALSKLHDSAAFQGMNQGDWDPSSIFHQATGSNLFTGMHGNDILSSDDNYIKHQQIGDLTRGRPQDALSNLLGMYGYNPQDQMGGQPQSASMWPGIGNALQGAGNRVMQGSGAPSLWQMASSFLKDQAEPWMASHPLQPSAPSKPQQPANQTQHIYQANDQGVNRNPNAGRTPNNTRQE